MSEKDNGGPAFPTGEVIVGSRGISATQGMTLRDYFAAKAMQATGANPIDAWESNEAVAKWAYEMADAMLKTREA